MTPPRMTRQVSADSTRLVCLYDYAATAPDDLSITRGEWLYADLQDQVDDSRLWAYSPGTKRYGYVPRAYAKPPNTNGLIANPLDPYLSPWNVRNVKRSSIANLSYCTIQIVLDLDLKFTVKTTILAPDWTFNVVKFMIPGPWIYPPLPPGDHGKCVCHSTGNMAQGHDYKESGFDGHIAEIALQKKLWPFASRQFYPFLKKIMYCWTSSGFGLQFLSEH